MPLIRYFGDPSGWPDDDYLGWSDEFNSELVLAAYREGVFPMPVGSRMGWWSPVRRGILDPAGMRVSKSLARSVRKYRVTVNQAFPAVVSACADPDRPGGWITPRIAYVYRRLHVAGYAVSVESWLGDELVGGLYGVSLGGLFAGESMFHLAPDASKVALVGLCRVLGEVPGRLIDVQWVTPHLASLGAVEVGRTEYLDRLEGLLRLPGCVWQ